MLCKGTTVFHQNLYLLWLKITNDSVDVSKDFINEWTDLPDLDLHEVTATFLSDLNERVACHVLHSIMCF